MREGTNEMSILGSSRYGDLRRMHSVSLICTAYLYIFKISIIFMWKVEGRIQLEELSYT